MSDKKLHLRVVSPSKLIYEDDVDMIIMRTQVGDMGILPDHENTTTLLSLGAFRVMKDGTETELAVLGGFAEVTATTVTVLSDAAELASDIDKARALEAKTRAEGRISGAKTDIDLHRAELALRRALVRVDVYDATHKR